MAKDYDERIVELTLENKEFEKNSAQTIKSLDKLKESLKFDSIGDSFESITKSASRVNLNPISDGVQKVSNQFNLLTTIADTAFRNLTNKAIDAGERMIKSLSIDQVTSGWSKYAEQTGAVQTIMAATAQQFGDQATQMEEVNNQLEKLTWFTDETSHKFTDMVSGIGKFTANNIDLETSVKAMEGIATWASLSGANTNEASRAIYNLAQAISVGSVKLIDWRSIENANMGTTEFKQTVIETAEAVGTLVKVSDNLWSTLDGKGTVSVANFSENLSKGWFTSDVLLKSLEAYGGFADRLNKFTEETGVLTATAMNYIDDYVNKTLNMNEATKATGMSAEELIPWLQELGSAENDLGRRAFRAAQETKTFQEAIDYVKEAVSSGYATSFKYIFGDYLEAKAWWSEIAEVMYDVFVVGGEIRNQVLSLWKDDGGRETFLEGIRKLIENTTGVLDIFKSSWNEVFFGEEGEEQLNNMAKALLNFTEGFKEFAEAIMPTEDTARNLSRILKSIFTILNNGVLIIKTVGRALEPIFDLTNRFSGSLLEVVATLSELASGRFDSFMQNKGLQTIYNTVNGIAKILATLASGSLTIIYGSVQKIISTVDRFRSTFQNTTGGFEGFITAVMIVLEEFWESFKSGETIINSLGIAVVGVFKGIYGAAKTTIDEIIKFFKLDNLDFSEQLENIPDFLRDISDILSELKLDEKFRLLIQGVNAFIDSIAQLFIDLNNADSAIRQIIGSISNEMFDWYTWMKNTIQAMDAESIAKVGILVSMLYFVKQLGNIAKSSSNLLSSISGTFNAFSNVIKQFAEPATMLDKINTMFKQTKVLQFGISILLLVKALNDITLLDQEAVIQSLITLGLAMGLMVVVMKQFAKVSETLANLPQKEISKQAMSLSLLEMAGALILMVEAITKIKEAFGTENGGMNWLQLIGSFSAVVVSLYALYETARLLGSIDSTGIVAAAGSMSLMGVALVTMVAPIIVLGQMPLDKLANGVGAVGLMLLSMGAAAFTMQKTDWKSILAAGPAFAILAGAITILSASIFALSKIGIGELTAATVALTISMPILAASIAGMAAAAKSLGGENMMVAGASLTVLSVGIITLAGAMAIFTNSVDWEKTGHAGAAIGLLVGAFVALAAIGVVNNFLPGFSNAMLEAGAAMMEFGIGAAAFGVAVALISGSIMALTLLAPAIGMFAETMKAKFGIDMPSAVDEGFKVIERVIQDFLMMIPHIIPQLTLAIASIITAINVAIWAKENETAVTVISFILTMINVIVSMGPQIIEGIVALFGVLTTYIPKVLKAAADYVEELFAGFGTIIHAAIVGIFRMIFNIIWQDGESLLARITSVFTGGAKKTIEEVEDTVSKEGKNLGDTYYNTGKDSAELMKNGLEEGNKEVKKTAEKEGEGAAQAYKDGFIGKNGLDDPVEESAMIHEELATLVGNGIKNSTDDILPVAQEQGGIVGEGYGNSFLGSMNDVITEGLNSFINALDFDNPFGSAKLFQGKSKKEEPKYQKKILSDASRERADRKVADLLGIEYSKSEKKEVIEDVTDFGVDIGEALDTGIGKGISKSGSSSSAAKSKGEEIADAYSKAISSIDLSDKTDTLQYQLWEAMNPEADEAVKQQMKIKMLMQDIESQSQRVSAATDQYNQSLAELGKEAEETTKALQTLMEQETKYYQLLNDLKEAQSGTTETTDDSAETFRSISEEYHKMALDLEGFGFTNEQIWNSIARPKGADKYVIGTKKTTEAVEEMVDALQVSSDILSGNVINNFNKVAEAIDDTSEVLTVSATALSNSMYNIVEGTVNSNFEDIGNTICDPIIGAFEELPNNISKTVTDGFVGVVDNITDPINSNMETAMTNTGYVICDTLGSSINANTDLASTQSEVMSNSVINASKETLGIEEGSKTSSVFEGIGNNIIDGLRFAIEAGESAVVTAMINMITRAIEAAKAAADINSPSGEMEYVGEMMDLGVVKGTEKYSYLVRQGAAQVITDSIRDAEESVSISGVISKYVSSMLGGNTITLDLDVDTSELDRAIGEYQSAKLSYSIGAEQIDKAYGPSTKFYDKLIRGIESRDGEDNVETSRTVRDNELTKLYNETLGVVTRQLEVAQHLANMQAINSNIKELYNTNDINVTFNQTNNSPQALSRLDIYRDTKKQLDSFSDSMKRQNLMKGVKL